VVEAVRHMRTVQAELRQLMALREEEVFAFAKQLGASVEILLQIRRDGVLPVVNFAAGGIATPADAALMMQLGAEGVFVGSGIFKSGDPVKRASAIVKATTHFRDAKMLAEISRNLGEPMVGRSASSLSEGELMSPRGW